MTDNVQWAEILAGIMEELFRLEAGLVAMKRECLRLEADGMYPGVPTGDVWEPRANSTHGEKRYLRLTFPAGTLPGGRRKLYVGCNSERIAEARKLAGNRCRWEELEGEIRGLERYLRMTCGDLQRVAGSVKRYELPEGLPLLVARELGTDDQLLSVDPVPKEEWVLTGPLEVEYNLDLEAVVIEEGSDG